jgi:2-phosphoglycerate kinase
MLVSPAPAGVGKSVLAAELAYRLGIARVVSTDSVRQALRSLISPELSPILHASSYAAWRAELLPDEIATAKPKRKRVVRGFQAQVQQMNRAIDAIIDRNVKEDLAGHRGHPPGAGPVAGQPGRARRSSPSWC